MGGQLLQVPGQEQPEPKSHFIRWVLEEHIGKGLWGEQRLAPVARHGEAGPGRPTGRGTGNRGRLGSGALASEWAGPQVEPWCCGPRGLGGRQHP